MELWKRAIMGFGTRFILIIPYSHNLKIPQSHNDIGRQ